MSRTKRYGRTLKGLSVIKYFGKRKRRAKQKQAVRSNKFENVPTFKKTDKYDYY